ncbi:MAG: metalloprotease TldD [Gammaproteobacteria bacterium]
MATDDTNLLLAAKTLLHPNDLDLTEVEKLLQTLSHKDLDDADLYFQYLQTESWGLEDGIVKDNLFSIRQGVGIRAIKGAETGFAYSDEISNEDLKKTIQVARSVLVSGESFSCAVSSDKNKTTIPQLYPPLNPLNTLNTPAKVKLLKDVYAEILRADSRVLHAAVSITAQYAVILVAAMNQPLRADIRPSLRFNVSVILQDKDKRESGSSSCGGRVGYDFLLKDETALKYAREAVRVADIALRAKPAPAGNMPVILGSGWPGILLHEAVGHGLEGDFNRKGSSVFSGRIGERVASSVCTVVDQGNIPGGLRGSLNMDDEGTPTQKTVLIENGILRGYMQDKMNARLMKTVSTGNGRRESYASLPLPRMTATYLLPGESTPEEIIASVDHGIYAVNFSGGQVDITSGNFVFSTNEAYLIEKGEITCPLKNVALIGNGPEVLTKVSMVGNDLVFDPGVGTCGKEGQGVPVNVGQPTLKVDILTVGGTST